MKVVLDINVLVSGLLNPYGAPGEIVRTTSAGTLQLCHDARIVSEYRDVLLRPKFHFNEVYVDALLDQIKACGHLVTGEPLRDRLPDSDDEMFLEVALGGRAECLITGNMKHYPPARRHGVRVVDPAQFLRRYFI